MRAGVGKRPGHREERYRYQKIDALYFKTREKTEKNRWRERSIDLG